MSGQLRLLAIEARRGVGMWLFLPLAAIAWYLAQANKLEGRALVWAETSVMVRDAIAFAGPCIAGAAAWMAGRERRRGIEDLLATTPLPATSRRLATWAGTALWAVLAYVAVGAYIVALTALRAVWGGPVLWPMVVGLLALPAHAALGFALGRLLPSRFTAPLAAIALFFAQVFIGNGVIGSAQTPPNSRLDWVSFLSPVARLDTSVWYGVRPNVGLPQTLFLLGLTGLALGGVALRDRRGIATWGALLAAGFLATAGVALLIRTVPPGGTMALSSARNNGLGEEQAGLIAYEPVCSTDPLPVCVHPAYQPRLREYAAAINRIAAPLVGLPGAPTRAEQRATARSYMTDDGIVLFQPDWEGGGSNWNFAGLVAQSLVRGGAFVGPIRPACPDDPSLRTCWDAQEVIAIWLLRQAGASTEYYDMNERIPVQFRRGDSAGVRAAADRFAALDPGRRQEWLRAHYADLRAGKIRLEDLP